MGDDGHAAAPSAVDARSTRKRRRICAVVPPKMPTSSLSAKLKAHSRHGSRTGQPAHTSSTALAPSLPPAPRLGKNNAGSSPRHAAASRHGCHASPIAASSTAPGSASTTWRSAGSPLHVAARASAGTLMAWLSVSWELAPIRLASVSRARAKDRALWSCQGPIGCPREWPSSVFAGGQEKSSRSVCGLVAITSMWGLGAWG